VDDGLFGFGAYDLAGGGRGEEGVAAGNRRVYRPWIPEPGLWLQFDWGEGPPVAGQRTQLWCAWLAWSRFRVVLPTVDKTLPTLLACLDQTLRRLGGVPTYALTDNERTVTVEHVASVAVRHPQIVAAGRHYGLSIATCVPADPESRRADVNGSIMKGPASRRAPTCENAGRPLDLARRCRPMLPPG
jgi:hypothetical protein